MIEALFTTLVPWDVIWEAVCTAMEEAKEEDLEEIHGRVHIKFNLKTPQLLCLEIILYQQAGNLQNHHLVQHDDIHLTVKKEKHKRKWTPVKQEETKAFIGIMINMGIIKLPRMHMYWNTDNLLHQESVSSIMTQTWFLQIWR